MTLNKLCGKRQALIKLGLDDSNDSLSKYLPYIAALGAAGITAPLAYRSLRKVTPTSNPVMQALRDQAGGEFTRVLPNKPAKTRIGNWIDRMLHTGGDPVIYGDVPLATAEAKKVRGAVRYTEPAERKLVQGDVAAGGAPAHADILKRLQDDKWEEYVFWRKHVPDAFGDSENMADVLTRLGYTPGSPLSKEQEATMLYRLSNELKAKYPNGFLMKETGGLQSGGIFPSEKTKFNTMLRAYRRAGLHDRWTRGLANLEKDYGGDIGSLISELRDHPAYEGRVLHQLLQDPRKVMVQQKLNIAQPTSPIRNTVTTALGGRPNREMRVHVEHGVAVPELTAPRYDPVAWYLDQDHLRGATQYAQSIVDKLPPEHRNMSWAMDIVPIHGGGYNLVESNPGGQSGFLSPEILPLQGIHLRKAYMGNHAKPVSALTAGVAATGAGLLAGAGTHAYQDSQEIGARNAI